MNHNQLSQDLQTYRANWINGSEIHSQQVRWVGFGNEMRTATSIITALLKTHRSLNEEVLHRFLIEVGAIANSRPLRTEI